METITFYSYKGGVGRTLALSNTAIYLSRFGNNVCVMDFDLEAPGLHYKFPEFIKPGDINKGLVDYIYAFVHNKAVLESLNGFTMELDIPLTASGGGIRLFPAGDIRSPKYWQKLASIDWHNLFYEESGEGTPFFLELKERIRKEFNPDFLLIDSRTGVTEMSGLCTALLPDKVVFLIVNNRENIDGARRILRAIQVAERFPGQKPIEVEFALTRIPFSEGEKGEKIEQQILKDAQDFLNEPTKDIESQLDVQDICVLHSDRELELSESLRVGQEGITRDMPPLQRDYLRLISKIVPDEIIASQLPRIVDGIATSKNLLNDPDKAQHDLELVATSYPQPPIIGELIKFYILRNAGREKILSAFHKLWECSGIENPEMLSKYVSFFMKWDLRRQNEPDFKLEIIEKYLKSSPYDETVVEARLIEACKEYNIPKMALKHYIRILGGVEEKDKILGEILDISIKNEIYNDVARLFEKYSDIIDESVSLRLKQVEIMLGMGKSEEVLKLLDEGWVIENDVFKGMPRQYFDLMTRSGRLKKANKKLFGMVKQALQEKSGKKLYEVGTVFYRLDRADEFGNRISNNHPAANETLRKLRHEFR